MPHRLKETNITKIMHKAFHTAGQIKMGHVYTAKGKNLAKAQLENVL